MHYGKLLASAAFVLLPSMGLAATLIDNGTIQLGVNDLGHLNVPGPDSAGLVPFVGVRDLRTNFEATAPGCLCEGWGVAVGDTPESGYVTIDSGGVSNLTGVSFVFDASTATSVVDMGTSLRVTHYFAPSVSSDLYRVTVSIENISGVDITDLRYTRVMDWDVEPTPFDEYVTIGGTAAASAVLSANTNGFGSGDPFAADPDMGDFVDLGPLDHGAQFNFGFGALAADATKSFDIFYGASPTEREAFAALFAVGAEVYSLGQASDDIDGTGPDRSTFIFGFKGVGGVIVPPPPPIPVPASIFLLTGGLALLGGLRARRKAA